MPFLSPVTDNCPSCICRRERKDFMINLNERMVPDWSIEPATNSWAHTRLCYQGQSGKKVHYNIFITLLLGSKAETMFFKQLCYIQTKMYRLYRKMTIYTFLGSIFKSCYIQNLVITKSVIKRFVCIALVSGWSFLKNIQKICTCFTGRLPDGCSH